jgi:hypothetical protein
LDKNVGLETLYKNAMREGAVPVEVLEGKEDRYEGILIDEKSLPDDPDEFARRLQHSLLVSISPYKNACSIPCTPV